jgi:hypothetical protein
LRWSGQRNLRPSFAFLKMEFLFYHESRHRSGYAADCDVVVCYGGAKPEDDRGTDGRTTRCCGSGSSGRTDCRCGDRWHSLQRLWLWPRLRLLRRTGLRLLWRRLCPRVLRLPHTSAVTMVRVIGVHTPTTVVPGIIAGIGAAGDRKARLLKHGRRRPHRCQRPFRARACFEGLTRQWSIQTRTRVKWWFRR